VQLYEQRQRVCLRITHDCPELHNLDITLIARHFRITSSACACTCVDCYRVCTCTNSLCVINIHVYRCCKQQRSIVTGIFHTLTFPASLITVTLVAYYNALNLPINVQRNGKRALSNYKISDDLLCNSLLCSQEGCRNRSLSIGVAESCSSLLPSSCIRTNLGYASCCRCYTHTHKHTWRRAIVELMFVLVHAQTIND